MPDRHPVTIRRSGSGSQSRIRRRAIGGSDYDQLYLHLKGARERLCLAQMQLPPHAAGRGSLGKAVALIDAVGAVWCPAWSQSDADHLLPESGLCERSRPSWRQVGLLVNGDEFIPQHLVTYPFAVPPGQAMQAVYVRADP